LRGGRRDGRELHLYVQNGDILAGAHLGHDDRSPWDSGNPDRRHSEPGRRRRWQRHALGHDPHLLVCWRARRFGDGGLDPDQRAHQHRNRRQLHLRDRDRDPGQPRRFRCHTGCELHRPGHMPYRCEPGRERHLGDGPAATADHHRDRSAGRAVPGRAARTMVPPGPELSGGTWPYRASMDASTNTGPRSFHSTLPRWQSP